jgi:superfamily II DNA or RNA helicase
MIRRKLWAHNKQAIEFLEESFKTTDSAVVVQPTGSGKSGVMFGYIESVLAKVKNVIVIQPSLSIESAQKASSLWNKKLDSKVRYITYSKMANLRKMTKENLVKQGFTDVDLIILDEVHHIAAPIWSQGYECLKALNPACKIIGLTATPIRYLDGGRNVAEEYFHGNVIETLTLIQAIQQEIFAKPKYITAYYGKDEILADMLSRINSFSCSEDARASLYAIYTKLRDDWNRQSDLDEKIEHYINLYLPDVNNLKFVIFTSGIAELQESKEIVKAWFKKRNIRKKINTFEVYSGNGIDDETVFKGFARTHKDSVDLLFAVDKLNEGVHLKELSGIIMLRNTSSPTIYYQQLGRIFHTGMKRAPLVFDFVNNHNALAVVRSTLIDPEEVPVPIKGKGTKNHLTGVEYSTVTMHDEMMDLSILLDKLDVKLVKDVSPWTSKVDDAWESCYGVLSDFVTSSGRLPSANDDFTLFSWFRMQIVSWLSETLDAWKKDKLQALGVRVG